MTTDIELQYLKKETLVIQSLKYRSTNEKSFLAWVCLLQPSWRILKIEW